MLDSIFQLLGRTHPLFVHLPIGIIFITFIYEAISLVSSKILTYNLQTARFLNYSGLFFTVFSIIAGLLLEKFDAYNAELISNHKIAGYVTLVLVFVCVIFFTLYDRNKSRTLMPYRISLTMTIIALSITGHQGGNLTHGETYLTEPIVNILNPSESHDPDQDDFHAGMLLAELNQSEFVNDRQKEVLSIQVRKAFQQKCYQCHSELNTKGGLVMSTIEGLELGGDSGLELLTSTYDKSELYRRITLPPTDKESMPSKGHPLTKNEIELVKIWIDNGAYWSDDPIKVFPEATLQLAEVELPKNPSLSNPIDRLIDYYFKENNLDWSEMVDDKMYLKRVSLDIIGKFPDEEIINEFMISGDPQKREQLVDKLLLSRTDYTQNWLTFWNDHLRNDYTGTGYITGGRKSITQWLYKSLYDNKPYNHFVKELIDTSSESEGFIRGIQWRGSTNSSQTVEMQAAQNVGQVLLGVNIKCASCHDSFVSNTTLKEAYNFASLFSDKPLEIHRCDKPTGNISHQAFLYPELGSVVGNTREELLKSLSEIMVKPENGRLYRTLVNRYWKYFFGRAIIYKTDQMDDMAWNGDLLDWLSAYLIENNYDLKKLIKLIVTSRTYQLPSIHYENEKDLASNKYVFKGPLPRRLSVEKFIDVYSQFLEPIYKKHSRKLSSPYQEKAKGSWISKKVNNGVRSKNLYSRYKFKVNNKNSVKSAILLSNTFGNHTKHSLFINNKLVTKQINKNGADRIDIKPFLVKGINVIAVKAENSGSSKTPLAFFGSLKLRMSATAYHFTGNKWKVTDFVKNGENWKAIGYNDTHWSSPNIEKTLPVEGFVFNPKGDDYRIRMGKNYRVRASLTEVDSFQSVLGRPNREIVATSRETKASLLESLELNNGGLLASTNNKSAKYLMKKFGNNTKDISEYLYRSLLLRKPNQGEQVFIKSEFGENFENEQDLSDLIWLLVLSPEFNFIT